MDSSNIETFDKSVASVLNELYQKFPEPAHLVFNDLIFELWDDDSDDEKSYFKKHSIYAYTVSWLERSGFIWLVNTDAHEAHEVVLTPKGLELLKMPSSLERPSESFGDQIREALDKDAKDTAAGLVSKALTASISLLAS
jgi:hypothetical protein